MMSDGFDSRGCVVARRPTNPQTNQRINAPRPPRGGGGSGASRGPRACGGRRCAPRRGGRSRSPAPYPPAVLWMFCVLFGCVVSRRVVGTRAPPCHTRIRYTPHPSPPHQPTQAYTHVAELRTSLGFLGMASTVRCAILGSSSKSSLAACSGSEASCGMMSSCSCRRCLCACVRVCLLRWVGNQLRRPMYDPNPPPSLLDLFLATYHGLDPVRQQPVHAPLPDGLLHILADLGRARHHVLWVCVHVVVIVGDLRSISICLAYMHACGGRPSRPSP